MTKKARKPRIKRGTGVKWALEHSKKREELIKRLTRKPTAAERKAARAAWARKKKKQLLKAPPYVKPKAVFSPIGKHP